MLKSILLSVSFFMFIFSAKAQDSTTNYYIGKWKVLVKETPMGDVTMPIRFDVKEGKLKGFYVESGATEEKQMDSVSINAGKIFMAFRASNYDLTVTMTKKDDDHTSGRLLEMFDVEGTRVKEEEKK